MALFFFSVLIIQNRDFASFLLLKDATTTTKKTARYLIEDFLEKKKDLKNQKIYLRKFKLL